MCDQFPEIVRTMAKLPAFQDLEKAIQALSLKLPLKMMFFVY